MAQTILITGASTGIGRATAEHFQKQGWNVIATMRTPDKGAELGALNNVLVTRLDVTDAASIAQAVSEGIAAFGSIDVLLNNAGYGAFGPLEAFPMENVRRQFDTNVIGLLETTKAVLPHMRRQRSGHIVNVSSMGGKIAFPLGTLYHGTKFAVEGISEGLHYELAPIGIKVKVIEPGAIETDFAGRSFDFTADESLTEYEGIVKNLWDGFGEALDQASPATLVAEAIMTSVTDDSDQLRYAVGADAVEALAARTGATDEQWFAGMRERFKL